MTSVTLVALSERFRYVVEATLTSGALFALFTLFVPDPTAFVVGPATVLAVVGGFTVASYAATQRSD